MRIKIASSRVYEAEPLELIHRLHETSTMPKVPFRQYLEGFVTRLRPMKVWLEVPTSVAAGSDAAYAKWLTDEMFRLGRWSETTDLTDEEKEAKAQAAAEAKKKAAAEKAAQAAAEKKAGVAATPGADATPAAARPAAAKPATVLTPTAPKPTAPKPTADSADQPPAGEPAPDEPAR